jgi:hypothetical protein
LDRFAKKLNHVNEPDAALAKSGFCLEILKIEGWLALFYGQMKWKNGSIKI